MRVLHVIPSVAPRYGGPSTAIRGMTAALAARGVAVTVATTDADGSARMEVPLDHFVHRDGVAYRYFARSLPGEYKVSWPLTGWLRRHVGEFDVVHVHALFSYATIPGCRLALRAGVPYIVRPLGTLAEWSLGHKSWKKAPYLALVERPHLRHASAIHVTSEAEARAVAALGFAAPPRIIPLGVPVSSAQSVAQRAELVSRRAADAGTPLRVLFLSRIHPVKGLPLLIAAAERADRAGVRAVELVVAGSGEPGYVETVQALARGAGLRVPVRFLGHVEGDQRERAYAEADVFALPSSSENFGIAAAEALARGLPVVLSREVGVAPAVEAAGAGLVVGLDAESLAAALMRLARGDFDLAQMSLAARQLAVDEYSWDRSARAMIEMYREGIAARRRQIR